MDRFEKWLSANRSFRFHAQGGEPQIDLQQARIRLLEKIKPKEIKKRTAGSLTLIDPDTATDS